MTWIAVRDVVPGLDLPPYFIAHAELRGLRHSLREAGFKVFEADAESCRSERELLIELGDAMGFPDFYGANWDAFDDCIGDRIRANAGATSVLIVGIDSLMRSDVHAFVRSVHLLLETANVVEQSGSDFQLECFFVGRWGAIDS